MQIVLEIENFKAFTRRVRVPFRPLTLIFGPNSAGKSSIFQAMYLLREMLFASKESRFIPKTLTFSGEDLGDFVHVVTGHDPAKEIAFSLIQEHETSNFSLSVTIRGYDAGYEVSTAEMELPDKRQDIHGGRLRFDAIPGDKTYLTVAPMFIPRNVAALLDYLRPRSNAFRRGLDRLILWRALRDADPHGASFFEHVLCQDDTTAGIAFRQLYTFNIVPLASSNPWLIVGSHGRTEHAEPDAESREAHTTEAVRIWPRPALYEFVASRENSFASTPGVESRLERLRNEYCLLYEWADRGFPEDDIPSGMGCEEVRCEFDGGPFANPQLIPNRLPLIDRVMAFGHPQTVLLPPPLAAFRDGKPVTVRDVCWFEVEPDYWDSVGLSTAAKGEVVTSGEMIRKLLSECGQPSSENDELRSLPTEDLLNDTTQSVEHLQGTYIYPFRDFFGGVHSWVCRVPQAAVDVSLTPGVDAVRRHLTRIREALDRGLMCAMKPIGPHRMVPNRSAYPVRDVVRHRRSESRYDDHLLCYVGWKGDAVAQIMANTMPAGDIPLDKEHLDRWLTRLTGYRFSGEVFKSPLHERLYLSTLQREGLRLSLSDVGSGVSQVLPLLVQMCVERPAWVFIEQPELHLHPAMQGDLAEALCSKVNNIKGPYPRWMAAETHSEHFLLRVLRMIREGKLKAEDVSVLYVAPGEEGSTVKDLRINSNGEFLDPWPSGFFSERWDELGGDEP